MGPGRPLPPELAYEGLADRAPGLPGSPAPLARAMSPPPPPVERRSGEPAADARNGREALPPLPVLPAAPEASAAAAVTAAPPARRLAAASGSARRPVPRSMYRPGMVRLVAAGVLSLTQGGRVPGNGWRPLGSRPACLAEAGAAVHEEWAGQTLSKTCEYSVTDGRRLPSHGWRCGRAQQRDWLAITM